MPQKLYRRLRKVPNGAYGLAAGAVVLAAVVGLILPWWAIAGLVAGAYFAGADLSGRAKRSFGRR